jgi:hypothetical protein
MESAQLIKYRFGTVSAAVRYEFLRNVGLVPVVGPVSFPAIRDDAARYLKRWRARVDRLAAAGLSPPCPLPGKPLTGRKWQMLNCPPPFAVCYPQVRPCRHTTLCPSCWDRAAAEIWDGIDAKLFPQASTATPPGGRALPRSLVVDDDDDHVCDRGLTMIARAVTYRIPMGAMPLREFLAYRCDRDPPGGGARRRRGGIPSRAAEILRFRRAGVVAGLDAIHIGRTYDRSEAAIARAAARHAHLPTNGWEIEIGQVLFCPTAEADGIGAHPSLCGRPAAIDLAVEHDAPAVARFDAPSRREVARKVALALRYPRCILTAGPKHVRQLLEARKGRRLSATFGKFT